MPTNLDQLAQGLASGTVTRRRALAILGASAIGLALPGIAKATEVVDKKCDEKCTSDDECKKYKEGKDDGCTECREKKVKCKKKECNLEGNNYPSGEGECGTDCHCVPDKYNPHPKKGKCEPKKKDKVCQKPRDHHY